MVGLAVSCIFMGKGWEGMGRDGMWLSWHSRCSVRVGVFRGGGGEVDVEKKRGLGGGGGIKLPYIDPPSILTIGALGTFTQTLKCWRTREIWRESFDFYFLSSMRRYFPVYAMMLCPALH
jgi:hypothetical protein